MFPYQIMHLNNINKKRGFTLIEMLVSIAIFSVVMVIVMGTIVTIVDVSRKTRTMTEAMSNLNFVVESMTRTLKTAIDITVTDGSKTDEVRAIDQNQKEIVYEVIKDDTIKKNRIQKTIVNCGSSDCGEYITSEDIDITGYTIQTFQYNNQPRVMISLKGRVETTRGIYSEFILQATVAQRKFTITTP
jgi:prepilin-type N-terminal cleavage/methylation domain-containing protein